MNKIEKMRKFRRMVMFFKRHSLGFIPIFYKYHPGPMWVVKHAKDLDLTVKVKAAAIKSKIENNKIFLNISSLQFKEIDLFYVISFHIFNYADELIKANGFYSSDDVKTCFFEIKGT